MKYYYIYPYEILSVLNINYGYNCAWKTMTCYLPDAFIAAPQATPIEVLMICLAYSKMRFLSSTLTCSLLGILTFLRLTGKTTFAAHLKHILPTSFCLPFRMHSCSNMSPSLPDLERVVGLVYWIWCLQMMRI